MSSTLGLLRFGVSAFGPYLERLEFKAEFVLHDLGT